MATLAMNGAHMHDWGGGGGGGGRKIEGFFF